MGNIIKAELYKLRKDRSFWLLTLLLVVASIIYPLLIVFDEGTELFKLSDFYQSKLLSANNYVIKLVPCILAGFFISKEYSFGTMKSIVSSGNSRIRIYFAKLVVFSIGAIIISLIVPVVLTGTFALYFDFQNMPELDYFLKTIGLIVLYAAAYASMMALLATLLTDSGKAIALMLLFFQVSESIMFQFADLIPVFEFVPNYFIFNLVWEIINASTFNNSEMFKMIIVPVVTFAVFGLWGSFVLQKKEIK
ncbi:ABC transporter permease [Virgibacillus oceani]|uniref:ABC transporter permease n=1 Tax=Virgibacillus oceani TaxID=1479511 RepID=A0A917HC61_9BACI|nr:ABC transporter permease [Virgibacillus oceani]GGG74347.1 ABC transporter permease [Virgibacillus oceani]